MPRPCPLSSHSSFLPHIPPPHHTAAMSIFQKARDLQDELGELIVVETRQHSPPMREYEGNPALYIEKVLKLKCWPSITEVLAAVEKPPYRVLVKSGHKIGKTHAAAAFINYWFDTPESGSFNRDSSARMASLASGPIAFAMRPATYCTVASTSRIPSIKIGIPFIPQCAIAFMA